MVDERMMWKDMTLGCCSAKLAGVAMLCYASEFAMLMNVIYRDSSGK